MQAYQFHQTVSSSHQITLVLPPDAPVGEAQITVLFADRPPNAPPAKPRFANIAEFTAWLETQPPTGRTAEDVDRQIREERDGRLAKAAEGHIEVINIGEPHGTNT